MEKQYKYDVFISYSRKDSEIADVICDVFDKNKISYFIDKKGILSGQEFVDVLVDSIRKSRIFLFIASQNSYNSPITLDEVYEALEYVSKGTLQIITYIIDKSELPSDLKFRLRRYNWRNLEECPIEESLLPDIFVFLGMDEKRVCKIIELDGKLGYGDENGNITIKPRWQSASVFCEGIAAVQDFNDKYGYINMRGEVVIPLQWQYAGSFSSGLARVELDNKYGFIDKTGSYVIECIWDLVSSFSFGLSLVACWVNGEAKLGFINRKGEIVSPCIWNDAHFFECSELTLVQNSEGLWGYINNKGELQIPCKYEWAENFTENKEEVYVYDRLGKRYLLNKQGVERLSPKYNSIGTSRTRFSVFKPTKTILVAEDEESSFELVAIVLKKYYHLLRAVNGIEAVTMYEDKKPNLIIMDVVMPEMNGLDATRIIKGVNKEIPIIVLSAWAFDENIKEAYDAGCDAFIAKPFRVEELLSKVEEFLPP